MDKINLQSTLKSTGTAYLCWLFGGFHDAYLGNWKIQLLYWFTLLGLFIWALLNLSLLLSKIRKINLELVAQINELKKQKS